MSCISLFSPSFSLSLLFSLFLQFLAVQRGGTVDSATLSQATTRCIYVFSSLQLFRFLVSLLSSLSPECVDKQKISYSIQALFVDGIRSSYVCPHTSFVSPHHRPTGRSSNFSCASDPVGHKGEVSSYQSRKVPVSGTGKCYWQGKRRNSTGHIS